MLYILLSGWSKLRIYNEWGEGRCKCAVEAGKTPSCIDFLVFVLVVVKLRLWCIKDFRYADPAVLN